MIPSVATHYASAAATHVLTLAIVMLGLAFQARSGLMLALALLTMISGWGMLMLVVMP